jgi:ribonuclease Y
MFVELALIFLLGALGAGFVVYAFLSKRQQALMRRSEEQRGMERREERLAMREEQSQWLAAHEKERLEFEREISRERQAIELEAKRVESQEKALQDTEQELRSESGRLEALDLELRNGMHELTKQRRLLQLKLHALTRMDKQAARQELMRLTEESCADELRDLRAQLLGRSESDINAQAQRTLLAAMQRITARPMNDATATVVTLSSEDLKGRIIGREGRNIRTFEQATGTTLLIDETPDSVLISCFDPVRREIARIALEQLLKDGRIHPASIEEAVVDATEAMHGNVIELGEGALRELRIGGVHAEVIQLLGKLHYRLSNNQNTLKHSIEVAQLASLLAAELGLDTGLALRAGLFHDIGKSMEEHFEHSHAKAGADLLKRLGEDERVVNAVAAHHEEVPAESPYAPLVMVADALSAVRPGARTSSIEGFIERVRTIEAIAKEEPGVVEAYALQAGRELRVIIQPEQVGEEASRILARRLRHRIEEEMTYPGSIRITVIREQRFVETAT